MKITKEELYKLIKEELQECMGNDMMGPMVGGSPAVAVSKHGHGDYDYRGKMTKSNLYNISKHATQLHNMLADSDDIEPWVQEKIAVATEAIETVAEYMEYEKLSDGHEHGPDCGCFEE